MQKPCPDCGALFPPHRGVTHNYMGSSSACWAAFNKVLAREFQNVTYFTVHRFTVDAYAVQHPGDQSDRRAVQSVNVHLTALYLMIEKRQDFISAARAMGALAEKCKDRFAPLVPPDANAYSVTIKNVLKAVDASEHRKIVHEWAGDVWRAWAPHHAVARDLADLIG